MAGARTGARASKTALKILCKSSLEYLRTLVAARDFGPGVLSDYSEISDSGDREEPREATERATEGATERRSWRGRLRPRTEIILKLELIFF